MSLITTQGQGRSLRWAAQVVTPIFILMVSFPWLFSYPSLGGEFSFGSYNFH